VVKLIRYFIKWAFHKETKCPRILMYHMVANHISGKYFVDRVKTKNYLRVEPKEFETQVKWLIANGYSFHKMSDVLLSDLDEKSIFITFDDGFEDNYMNAYQILKKYNVPATVYLVCNRFGGDWSTDRATGVASVELNSQPMLSDSQVKEMVASGLIEIGGHTLDHVKLNEISDDEAWRQISASRVEIVNKYNVACESFAYPFGYYNENNVLQVKQAGFKNACSTIDGVDKDRLDKRFQLKRIMISGNDDFISFKYKIKFAAG